MPSDHCVHLVVGPLRVVVEQDECFGAGRFRQPDRVPGGGVTEVSTGWKLLVGVLRVVEQHVAAGHKAQRFFMVGPRPARAGAGLVGQWSER